ncbi:ABC transporter ATP-binding protein [Crateriforma spongiae]|uniref:ABC transporter ATP-binding protein n=1 Tax=Crateriforma spongiae TaxID=2724528 RepID=UPI001445FF28|nr:ABC transporter ATP-binding protein [Crateriforma spongiae]
MIELQGLSKLYGRVIGVNDLCGRFPAGAYGLIGPNGSGKTTMINLLTGQLKPTTGRVRIFGRDPFRQRDVLRRIGLCPATDVLYPNVSARQWVRCLVRLHGFGAAESRRRADDALEQVGLSDAMDRPMGRYSLGMRQRAKLAQAIAHEPDLLILDEPYNGLDPVGRYEMTALLRRWHSAGRSLLFASHVLHEIESITRSFLWIHGGRLLASGTAEEIDAIVASTPQEIVLRGDGVGRLVQHLADHPQVQRIELSTSDNRLTVGVREVNQLIPQLTRWIADDSVKVDQLLSADGDLSAMFEALLRRHRGEQ